MEDGHELEDKPITEETIQAMRVSEKIANQYCLANKDTESLKAFCSKLWTYFAAGGSKMGLEYKLGTAKARQVVDPELGLTKVVSVTPGLKEQAARSGAFLISFLRSAGTKDKDGNNTKCKDVTSRIGMYKGRDLVLFGQGRSSTGEPNEGIVVGEPNALQKLALDAIEKEWCEITTSGCCLNYWATLGFC